MASDHYVLHRECFSTSSLWKFLNFLIFRNFKNIFALKFYPSGIHFGIWCEVDPACFLVDGQLCQDHLLINQLFPTKLKCHFCGLFLDSTLFHKYIYLFLLSVPEIFNDFTVNLNICKGIYPPYHFFLFTIFFSIIDPFLSYKS